MQMQRAATRLDLTVKKPELLHRPAAWRPRQTASPSDRLQESEVNESMRRQLLISNMLIRREQQSTAVCRQPGNVLQLRERSHQSCKYKANQDGSSFAAAPEETKQDRL